ncbi:MAG: hypothetical protein ABJA82_03960 [Myxococcales bacterium]
MIRLLASLRWRQLRWVAIAAIVPVLWACNARKLAPPKPDPKAVVKAKFQQSVNRDLDLLFMIDDSQSMAPLQKKMRDRLPDFMDVLKTLPGGLPNVHVAVVSSSLGAGVYSNVPGCESDPNGNTSGNMNGAFQHSAACTQLNPGEKFLIDIANPAGGRIQNFTGSDITPVFSCIADLGQKGCGFEHQFAATQLALERSLTAGDENAGFLRDSAYLAVVMLTNEDDCSVPVDSKLFDPAQLKIADPLGGLQSYRCNEFGHLCGGPPPSSPPHLPPPANAPVTLNNCHSAEDGKLVTVAGFTKFLKDLKPSNPDQVLVAAIAGPVTPYVVEGLVVETGAGMEAQPAIRHSCTSGTAGAEYADPAVRVKEWLDGFPKDNQVFQSICAADFKPAMTAIAKAIGAKLVAQCITGKIADNAAGQPDCDVSEQTKDGAGNIHLNNIPMCDGPGRGNASAATPCWEFQTDTNACPNPNSRLLAVCYEATCKEKPQNQTDALISCSVQ